MVLLAEQQCIWLTVCCAVHQAGLKLYGCACMSAAQSGVSRHSAGDGGGLARPPSAGRVAKLQGIRLGSRPGSRGARLSNSGNASSRNLVRQGSGDSVQQSSMPQRALKNLKGLLQQERPRRALTGDFTLAQNAV